jgi:hypothetical protein
VTWDRYADDLEGSLRDLHRRVHAGTYRAMRRSSWASATGSVRDAVSTTRWTLSRTGSRDATSGGFSMPISARSLTRSTTNG